MNTDLLNLITLAVFERGEKILSEPELTVVKDWLSNYAPDVPPREKNALILCLDFEHKFIQRLKDANKEDRANCKQAFAKELYDKVGLDIGLCKNTIELLAVVLFGDEDRKNGMNTDLLNVMKLAVLKRGEWVLSEPGLKVFNAFLSDKASDVEEKEIDTLKECLKRKFAQILRDANKEERACRKEELAMKLNKDKGLDIGLCRDTVELLAAVLFGEEQIDETSGVIAAIDELFSEDYLDELFSEDDLTKTKINITDIVKGIKVNPPADETTYERRVRERNQILDWARQGHTYIEISKWTGLPVDQVENIIRRANTFTDPRDGKTYKTVKIGEQVWMAENLAYNVKGSECYDIKYGRLYNWNTAMKACPPGWHLPSDDEWQTLVDFAGGEDIAGKRLKTKSGWRKNGNGTDDFGFAALPGGHGYYDGSVEDVGKDGYWWSSTEDGSDTAYRWNINYDYDILDENDYDKDYLFSIRCVQDYGEANRLPATEVPPVKVASSVNTFTDQRDGRVYRTVKIGKQVWMAENLAYDAKGSKCYANNESNVNKYGRLYDWNTAMKICPSGWHLPSKKEWQTLVDFVGGVKIAGEKLKATSGWDDFKGSSGNGTDDFDFSALPGGIGIFDGSFRWVGINGVWWSSSGQASEAYFLLMDRGYGIAGEFADKSILLSVRCVQDSPPRKN